MKKVRKAEQQALPLVTRPRVSRAVIRREELLSAHLRLGKRTIELSDYATTGLRTVIVGPSGIGKTSAALCIGEQLADQGWTVVIVDPEGEQELLYGKAVDDADDLAKRLRSRTQSIIVVLAATAAEFVPYGEAVFEAADRDRKPILLIVDEAQLFSSSRRTTGDIGKASDVMNDIVNRGRKRALDLVVTANRFSGTLSRAVFASKNLSLIGRAEDPTAWSALAPLFKGSKIGFTELMALAPGHFYCFSLRGVERVAMQMPHSLAGTAIRAKPIRPLLPTTFAQWSQVMSAMPTNRLQALDSDVVGLLSTVAGLTPTQHAAGTRALAQELEMRR